MICLLFTYHGFAILNVIRILWSPVLFFGSKQPSYLAAFIASFVMGMYCRFHCFDLHARVILRCTKKLGPPTAPFLPPLPPLGEHRRCKIYGVFPFIVSNLNSKY